MKIVGKLALRVIGLIELKLILEKMIEYNFRISRTLIEKAMTLANENI